MAKVYLSLGTNIGDKKQNMLTVEKLLAEKVGTILTFSNLYETEPWGFESENSFLNAAAVVETSFSPLEVLNITKNIELEMGRTHKSNGSYQDRIIDIDILMYDNIIFNSPELTLPHPLMHQRDFVLRPLNEIAPTLVHPILKKSINELLVSLESI